MTASKTPCSSNPQETAAFRMATSITHVSGTVTSDVECRFTESGIAVCRFHLTETPSQWDAGTQGCRPAFPPCRPGLLALRRHGPILVVRHGPDLPALPVPSWNLCTPTGLPRTSSP
ncbi:hypothetical protein [Streptomyces sp. NPDC001978]|uniref:hypothetical protein n=1 Tax=Streptomyces sp. NPDC001978 TaxID=3364627 RepID=UPI0036BC854C